MNVTWLDELHSAEQKINHLQWDLNDLSIRLSAVGFDKLADEVNHLAILAGSAEEHVKRGASSVLNENLDNSRAMTSAVVGLAFKLASES